MRSRANLSNWVSQNRESLPRCENDQAPLLTPSIHLPEATYLLGNLSQLYSPELSIGRTGACCSDHQSFLSYGYPASAVFERNGPIADPKYHNTGDVSAREGYDFDQIVSIAKVTMAALLTVGGWSRA